MFLYNGKEALVWEHNWGQGRSWGTKKMWSFLLTLWYMGCGRKRDVEKIFSPGLKGFQLRLIEEKTIQRA